MKNKTIITSVLAAAAIAIGVTTVVLVSQPAKETPNSSVSEQQQAAPSQNENLVSFTAVSGKSVLDQLKEQATVEVKDSSYGPYVDAINGKVGGTDNKYWSFYVDGQLAQVGAAEYMPNGGELIEWKFE